MVKISGRDWVWCFPRTPLEFFQTRRRSPTSTTYDLLGVAITYSSKFPPLVALAIDFQISLHFDYPQ